MLYLGTTPLAGNIKTKLFTTTGTFVVPADVYVVWLDGTGGGGGGGGGNSTPGGGGGGGGPCQGFTEAIFPVVPGETLTVTVGAAGTGGAPDNMGVAGGQTSVVGTYQTLATRAGSAAAGNAGANPNGGNGALGPNSGAGAAGGAGIGAAGVPYGKGSSTTTYYSYGPTASMAFRSCAASAGGALNFAGGAMYAVRGTIIAGAAGNASGGGGGHGGHGEFGAGGNGGANGAAGSNATGYGAGGGGGSGNTAGGNGSPGMVRIYYISKYTVE